MAEKWKGEMKTKGSVFGLGLLILLFYGMSALLQTTPFIGPYVNGVLAILLGLVGLLGLAYGVSYREIPTKKVFGEVGKFLVFLTGPWRLVEVLALFFGFSLPMLSLLPIVLGLIFLVADWVMAMFK